MTKKELLIGPSPTVTETQSETAREARLRVQQRVEDQNIRPENYIQVTFQNGSSQWFIYQGWAGRKMHLKKTPPPRKPGESRTVDIEFVDIKDVIKK